MNDVTTRADLLLHPVRLGIILALQGQPGQTARQIAAFLPDQQADATFYRHLQRLVAAHIVQVVATRPVRGTTEKLYAVADAEIPDLMARDFGAASADEHQAYFTTFLGQLFYTFRLYLSHHATFSARDFGYWAEVMPLSEDVYRALGDQMLAAVQAAKDAPVETGEPRRLIAVVGLTVPDPPAPDKA